MTKHGGWKMPAMQRTLKLSSVRMSNSSRRVGGGVFAGQYSINVDSLSLVLGRRAETKTSFDANGDLTWDGPKKQHTRLSLSQSVQIWQLRTTKDPGRR